MTRAGKIQAYQAGAYAESAAALYLRLKGYRIMARRFKTPVGEIDLIARRKKLIVAVEVKTRSLESDALEAVTRKNRMRVTRALEYFLKKNPQWSDHDIRFDVVVFLPPCRFLHLDNAWLAGS